MVHYRLLFSHPERWRDRPVDASATTAISWCQFRQDAPVVLEDEARTSIFSLSYPREAYFIRR
jgi:hypothetical protein